VVLALIRLNLFSGLEKESEAGVYIGFLKGLSYMLVGSLNSSKRNSLSLNFGFVAWVE